MLVIDTLQDNSMSHPAEDVCYTELHSVPCDLESLITSSTDPCMPDWQGQRKVVVEYIVQTEDWMYALPDSPQSLPEEECPLSEQDLLRSCLYEDSRIFDNDDDDASVMLDFMDLSFLDDESQTEEPTVDHSFTDSVDACATVVVPATTNCASGFQCFTPSPSPPTPVPSPTRSTSDSSSPPSPTTITTIPLDETLSSSSSSSPSSSTSSSSSSSSSSPETMTFHFCDLPNSSSNTPTTIITLLDPTHDSSSSSPSSTDASAPVVVERVSRQRQAASKNRGGQEEPMDFDSFDNSDDDGDEEADYKPYCDSRRGAKKNLLWKFLLWSLDHHSDMVCWTDVQKGVFKFVDTARVSTLWGQRKKKTDMTFEKLSRGIRHYYKRGLMERLSHTRLMYKFNWDKVPKRYRKA